MRLADYILNNIEAIVAEWEQFAATLLPAAADMGTLALRDHAQPILEAVAADLGNPQTREEQSEKSKGRAPVLANAPETAAQTHAILRAQHGFDINQLVAEYRALRASVLRLWLDAGPLDPSGMEDMIRFNEAIDQAIAESVSHFHTQVERSRNLLLGMLGHDMRSPLNTIITTASYLTALNAGEQISAAAARMIRSGASIRSLLDDLVDFNRTRLGLGMKIAPYDIDLSEALADELEQLRGAHPNQRIDWDVSGDTRGHWDASRLQQLVRNLVSNAIKYGDGTSPVRVALRGDDADVHLEVVNHGSAVDTSTPDRLFEPLKQGQARGDTSEARASLGLGLFIVREIARAHAGDVRVESSKGVTTFAVRLPRRRPG